MRYLKTLDLWDNNTQKAIIQGQIKLQVGQWVKCGSEHLSRFVKVSQGRTLWVSHPQGTPKETRERFKSLINAGKRKKTL